METADRAATAEPVDEDGFKEVMSRFATGVTVMTTLDGDGEVAGMTANAVTSVSLDPMLVLVCVERGTDMAARVVDGRRFALSMLTARQAALSNHFADPARSRGWAGFEDVEIVTAVTGSPILGSSLAWVDCTVSDIHPGGDHLVVVGEVVAARAGRPQEALGYFNHQYVTIPTAGQPRDAV